MDATEVFRLWAAELDDRDVPDAQRVSMGCVEMKPLGFMPGMDARFTGHISLSAADVRALGRGEAIGAYNEQ